MATTTKAKPTRKPKTRKYKPLTDAQRLAKRNRERELIENSVDQLTTSEGWTNWLTSRSQQHRYSLTNQLLIALQAPENTIRVAGFQAWLKLGYCVRKGEHQSVWIWAPGTPKQQREEAALNGEKARVWFHLVGVFTDQQVDPLPPPATVLPLSTPIALVQGDSLQSAWQPLEALAAEIGYTVTVDAIGEPGGVCQPSMRRIVINQDRPVNSQVRTLVHELAHALRRFDRQDDDPVLSYAQEELVVESVAMTTCGALGLPTDEYSIPYLASWADGEGLDVLKRAAGLVDRLASRIEKALPQLNPAQTA